MKKGREKQSRERHKKQGKATNGQGQPATTTDSQQPTVIANSPEVCFNPRLDALAQMRSALTEFYGRTLKDTSAVEEKVQRQLLHHFPQLSRAAVRL